MLYDRMDAAMVKAMIETLPLEVTVIDANDEVVGWNRHERRIFKRPMSAMGLNFRQCHPESSLPTVIGIVEDMRAGRRDQARFWIDLDVAGDGSPKHKILIEFFALRDDAGRYLGCMECTQDVEAFRGLSGQKRLLD